MQKPITPVVPVQRSCPASQARVRFEVAERPLQVTYEGHEAPDTRAPVLKIRGDGKKPFASQPVGLIVHVVAHSESVVNDDDARPRPIAAGCRQVGGHLASRSEDLHRGQLLRRHISTAIAADISAGLIRTVSAR